MLNWILLGVSAAVLIGLSLHSMRAAGDKEESGFLVANNSLGPFVAAATLIATGYSGFVFIGSPGVAYEYGSLELFANVFYTRLSSLPPCSSPTSCVARRPAWAAGPCRNTSPKPMPAGVPDAGCRV
nr:hypothetical protein [Halomonas elongata]